MAISTKGKRKIVVNQLVFYWYVKKGQLAVISADKTLIARYSLKTTALKIEKAPNRQELIECQFCFKRENDEISPQNVADFIQQLL